MSRCAAACTDSSLEEHPVLPAPVLHSVDRSTQLDVQLTVLEHAAARLHFACACGDSTLLNFEI